MTTTEWGEEIVILPYKPPAKRREYSTITMLTNEWEDLQLLEKRAEEKCHWDLELYNTECGKSVAFLMETVNCIIDYCPFCGKKIQVKGEEKK
jgi:hypothetical protein